MSKKILFINQETAPYVPETTLAVSGRDIPYFMQEKGYEIRTFMPKWGCINERRGQLHEVIRLSGMNLIIDDTDHPLIIKVASITPLHVQVYFIDNTEYFTKRHETISADCAERDDNGERAVFFARGVLETVKRLHWTPDIIFCQGAMSATVPLYVKTAYREEPSFVSSKVVTALFPDTMSKPYEEHFKKCLEYRAVKASTLKKYAKTFDHTELQKMAVEYSDALIEGAPDIDAETKELVRQSGKPSLDYPGKDCGDAYDAFFRHVFGE